MKPVILEDSDLCNVAAARCAVTAVRAAVEAHGRRELVAPPRHHVHFGAGSLVFTVGGTSDVVGFRVYDTFPGSAQDQVVAVWNTTTGELEGIAVGQMLGALRTGALGALAIDLLSNQDSTRCAVLGSGRQALTQMLCAASVRSFTDVAVYSPSPGHRARFAAQLADLTGLPVRSADGAESAVRHAQVVICATNSVEPVLDASWLTPGVHLNTLGPKSKNAHELPIDVAARATIIATDSPQQIAAQGDDYFLAGHESGERIIELADALVMTPPQREPDECTLFLSAGLAGTETLVAHALIEQAAVQKNTTT